MVDHTVWLHKHADFPGQALVDEKQRAFFEAVKLSRIQAVAKIQQIAYAPLDDEDEHC